VGDAWSLQVVNQIWPACMHYLAPWVLCSLQVHGGEKATHLLHKLCFNQFPSSVCSSEVCFSSVLVMVLQVHLWPLCHWRYGVPLKKWDNAFCPCCGHDPETTQHVLICPDPHMHLEYHSKVLILEQLLSSVYTMPDIQICQLQGLYGTTLPVFSLCQSLDTGSSPGTRPHWLD